MRLDLVGGARCIREVESIGFWHKVSMGDMSLAGQWSNSKMVVCPQPGHWQQTNTRTLSVCILENVLLNSGGTQCLVRADSYITSPI
ncbi:MAG: hypothetical protein GY750_06095 [Lentisphaerae bacterium]|nr:hypothetical protein [Lentisphaerota bacterium]